MKHAAYTFTAFGPGCRSKHRHTSKTHAESAIRRLITTGVARPGHSLNAYKCRSCKHWHIGNAQKEPLV